MSVITPPGASLVTQAQAPVVPQTSLSQLSQPQAATNTFGNAVNVDLSPPAQAVVASQNTYNPSTPLTQNIGQAPITTPAPSPDVAQLISTAKQKVIPQVGVSGASDVVDSQGNISKARLAVEIAEQAQKG